MSIIISAPDAFRQSVEAASGGVNTVLYDDRGYPSIMTVVPRFNIEDIDPALGSGVHPAFTIDGAQKSEIMVGKFQATIHDDRALSLPGQDPAASINFDTADQRCADKGPGWHMMTNAEWSAVALWCWKNGFMPRGNTDYGRDYDQTYETGRRQDGGDPGDSSGAISMLPMMMLALPTNSPKVAIITDRVIIRKKSSRGVLSAIRRSTAPLLSASVRLVNRVVMVCSSDDSLFHQECRR